MLTLLSLFSFVFFFFNDTATTEIYTLSLHDALPISYAPCRCGHHRSPRPALYPARGRSGGESHAPASGASHARTTRSWHGLSTCPRPLRSHTLRPSAGFGRARHRGSCHGSGG